MKNELRLSALMAMGAMAMPAWASDFDSVQVSSKGYSAPSGFKLPNSSKYKPHQGKGEIARRASQIKRGILQVSL